MEPAFWMGGRFATDLVEISHNLADVRKKGFWAIIGSFENEWTLARFAKVIDADFFDHDSDWIPLEKASWTSSLNREEYCQYVERIRGHISTGDVYQVNACRILHAPQMKNPNLSGLMRKIVRDNPAPFASYFKLPGIEIASASPERFLSVANKVAVSSPIKGTSSTDTFLEKDRAENLMVVDLIRNDMSSTARVGSVSTPRLLDIEEHPGLFHLVSDVQSEIADGKDIVNLLSAMMPPGSVSGAPKSSALRIIRENEGKRGPYCGPLGWIEGDCAEIAVGIRTFWQGEDGVLNFGTGAGITWGSDPMREWEETELKAPRLMAIASGKLV